MKQYLVFTGPESSGKSTLAERYAYEYGLPLVREYARTYLEKIGTNYTEKDVEAIAAGQLRAEALVTPCSTIVCDTDLLTIFIWKQEKYGKTELEWARILAGYTNRRYILCWPDMPWEYDVLRENKNDRHRLFDAYKKVLVEFGLSYWEVKGDVEKRMEVIKEVVE